jgi:hypothetical protein
MAKNLFLTQSNNNTIESGYPTVRIISSTSPDLRSGPSDVRDILCASFRGFGGYRTLFQVNGNGAFLIWTQEVFESASWSFDEAHTHVERHIHQLKAEATIILCNFNDPADEKPARCKTFMVSVLSLRAETAKSVAIHYTDRLALEEDLLDGASHRLATHRGYIKKNLAFIIAAMMLALLGATVVTMTILRGPTSKTNVWLSWDLPKDSKGPKNQLQFTWPHPNFTTWSAENDHSVDDFYLRLDDQAMIPTEYVEEYEFQYQEWYAKHYPWFAEIGASKAYLNESYWRNSRSFPLAIDHEFHVAHCVLTMKRYWTARESNRHVCPRDIDHSHISHCFGVLESYAFHVSLLPWP